jgi:hypothetical protein
MRRSSRHARAWRRVATLWGLAATGVAAPAWALCPNCLGQNATLSPTMRIVGVFLLVPPAVFFFVARLVRRLSRERP